MTLAPDEDLMLQVRDGAGEMLAVLFDRYQTPLFNFYSKLTGDRALSEDLVQEVFLRILKYRQSYRPGTPFRAWVYQIARNARIDHFRKFSREKAFEPEMLPPVFPADSAQERQEVELSQLLERELQEFDFLAFLGGIGRENRRKHFGLKSFFPRKLAEVVDAGVARNLVHPSAKRRSRAVTLAVFQDAKENLLDEVLAQCSVACQLRIEVEERGLVAVKQHA